MTLRAIARIDRHPWGPRLYVGGRRLHHLWGGAIAGAICLALGRPRAGAICFAYAATDWRDFPGRDCDNHRPRKAEPMSGPERHRRANHLHPARKVRDGRAAQRELKHRVTARMAARNPYDTSALAQRGRESVAA